MVSLVAAIIEKSKCLIATHAAYLWNGNKWTTILIQPMDTQEQIKQQQQQQNHFSIVSFASDHEDWKTDDEK